MKIKFLSGIALAVLVCATGAVAQETGVYGALDIGYHWPKGIDAESSGNAPDAEPYRWRWSSEDTAAGFARLGYQFNPNWRVELEGGYRPGDLLSALGNESQAVAGLCTQSVNRTSASPTMALICLG